MYPAEVVMQVVERNRCNVAFDLLARGVRQPSEATHVNSHREILLLNEESNE